MYQSGLTIKDALEAISKNLYVLPAIQREFVWQPDQICSLFDSLMQGYPFGTFLFWKVEPEKSASFKFYGFVQNYHERDSPHCPELGTLPNRELTAVLDGQQRLTALNIGIRGSLSKKEPRKHWTNPTAFPTKYLYLNILAAPSENEDGDSYEFRFLEPNELPDGKDALWYLVGDILKTTDFATLTMWIFAKFNEHGITGNQELFNRASKILFRLYEVVHTVPNLTYYSEKRQELERVLRIFIRMNSGGTVLSYSDLLLSIAVAQWSTLDARREISSLTDDLNKIGAGFNLSKDFVLKAGLMLSDVASVGFKVNNFNKENMATLEKVWPDVRRTLLMTVQLAASFGLSEQTLRADSALLPIAYYLYKKNPKDSWLVHPSDASDRESIRLWLIRSLLKASGIWGSGLDTLLTLLRTEIRQNHIAFPVSELEKVMAARGKSLAFAVEEIEELTNIEYGDKRIFPLLSILYPFVDVRHIHHVDHFFPRIRIQRSAMQKANCDNEYIEKCLAVRDRLSNLQLLEGTLNTVKNDSFPAEWMAFLYPDPGVRQATLDRHDLGTAPANASEFWEFYEKRRQRLITRMTVLLAV